MHTAGPPARSKMILPANPPYRHARVKQKTRVSARPPPAAIAANPMNRHGICKGHDGPATCLGSSLRLGPAPFTPERSAPGRFHPRRIALVQKRTAAALYAFGDLSQPIRTASAEAQRRRAASL